MTTKTKVTPTDDAGKPRIVASHLRSFTYAHEDACFAFLLEGARELHELAAREPNRRGELINAATHLETFAVDPAYRAIVIEGGEDVPSLASYLNKRQKGPPVQLRTYQARGFLQGVQVALDAYGDDLEGAAKSTLVTLHWFPLLLGGKPQPRIADLLDEAAEKVRAAIERSPTKRQRAEYVARAVLRVIGVPGYHVRKCYP